MIARVAAVLLVLVGLGACSAAVSDLSGNAAPSASPGACGADFPRNAALKDLELTTQQQPGGKPVCVGSVQAPAKASSLKSFLLSEFKRLGWKVDAKETVRPGSSKKQIVLELLGPTYGGNILIFPVRDRAFVNVILGKPLDFGRCQTTSDCITSAE